MAKHKLKSLLVEQILWRNCFEKKVLHCFFSLSFIHLKWAYFFFLKPRIERKAEKLLFFFSFYPSSVSLISPLKRLISLLAPLERLLSPLKRLLSPLRMSVSPLNKASQSPPCSLDCSPTRAVVHHSFLRSVALVW